MKSELNTLKDIISTIIHNQEKPATLDQLKDEAARIPEAITGNTFLLATDQLTQNYLFWQQNQLIRLADQLYKACLEKPRFLIRRGLVIVLNLLQAVRDQFPAQFDNTLQLPELVFLKRKANYQHALDELTAKFTRAGISEHLLRIALFPLSAFTCSKRPMRYCDDCYLARFAPLLREMQLEGLSPAAAEELLCARLITLNYNHLAFMDHVVAQVKTRLAAAGSKKEKELVLKRQKISIRSIQVIAGLAYDKEFVNLKAGLLEWAELEEEALGLLPETKKARYGHPAEPFKLELSVAILAFLTRLCKLNGFYPKERLHAELIDHMVGTYCTKQTSHISRDSFYNCYKAPTTNVARALRKLVKAILDDIDHFINTGVVRNEKDNPV